MKNSNSIIIMGSSRSSGETRNMAEELAALTGSTIIDLREKNISYFDYDHKNLDDDFFSTMEEVLQYDNIVFATPVYWFSMSAIMKTFFDRFSDLLHQRKDLGYQMKEKNMFLLTNSSTALLTRHFETPFEDTAKYLSMEYKGYVHGYFKDGELPVEVKDEIKEFATKIVNGG
ncbi:MAG: FMN reductase [Bacteroidetes bacterium]|nr:MAG: FMN reductase [Bacteroidota bacterium]